MITTPGEDRALREQAIMEGQVLGFPLAAYMAVESVMTNMSKLEGRQVDEFVMVAEDGPKSPAHRLRNYASFVKSGMDMDDREWFSEALEKLADQLESAPTAEVAEEREAMWYPMITAPKDGTEIQARIPGAGEDNVIAWTDGLINENDFECGGWQFTRDQESPESWTDGICWEINEDGVRSIQPTHWKNLPAPSPEEIAPKGEDRDLTAKEEAMVEAAWLKHVAAGPGATPAHDPAVMVPDPVCAENAQTADTQFSGLAERTTDVSISKRQHIRSQNPMIEELKKHVESLVAKASSAEKSEDSMRFSQAALNAANALVALQTKFSAS